MLTSQAVKEVSRFYSLCKSFACTDADCFQLRIEWTKTVDRFNQQDCTEILSFLHYKKFTQ